jgi:hypothetical protein
MKHIASLLIASVAVALVAGLTGCATSKAKQTTQQTENLLQAAGFKVMPATSADQQQLLKTLPAERVSAIRRKGQVYFVYPVHAQNLLYIGTNAQYLAYQQAAQVPQEDTLVDQEVESINRSVTSPGWEAPWGDWDSQ